MNPTLKSKPPRHLLGLGAVLVAGLGAMLVWLPLGDGLARLSYDLPFPFHNQVPQELVMVYLDMEVKMKLSPDSNPALSLDRKHYARLLDRLRQDQARLVLLDFFYKAPSADPIVDETFARAIGDHGNVVLVANAETSLEGNAFASKIGTPVPALARAAAGIGLARMVHDPDYVFRQVDPGAEELASVSWVAAELLKGPLPTNVFARLTPRWLNYYCPPESFNSINLDSAIEGAKPGFFRGKIVVVGERPSVRIIGASREAFGTPYSRFGRPYAPAASIHALSLLNLLYGDWLRRWDARQEVIFVLLWGLLLGAGLSRLRPWLAVAGAVLAGGGIAISAVLLQFYGDLWFNFVVPAAVQPLAACGWSLVWQYVLEHRRRHQLRQAFAAYLSPVMADKIADSDIDLAPGGHETEVTVMFTDLEGFTSMSETLSPAEVSRILNTYFNQTTQAILREDGTIIKYIGDAVMAVWGAPLPDARQADRAVLSAWEMSEAGKKEISGRRLRTRMGINSGVALAGNLGSDYRFDYTLIGDTVNFAARLEGLNKYLGTDILVSDATAQKLSGGIKLRCVGNFLVVGKQQAVKIHEVLGPAEQFAVKPRWLKAFEDGLACFEQKQLDQATAHFEAAISLRNGKDGPSTLYLNQIKKLHDSPPGPWTGIVKLTEK